MEGRPDTGVVTRAGLLYLGLALAGLVLSRLQVELVGRIGEWFVRELRSRTVDHVMSMSVRYFDRTPAGVLVSRMTADVDALQDAVQLGVVPFTQAVLGVGGALAARDAVSVGTLSAFVLYLLLAFDYAGVDLRDVTRRALRSRIVMVVQEGQLTTGTLAHNLRAVRPGATHDELAGALASVGAGSWLDSLPDGLATQVGEGGSLLSAGERQLVALARVCLLGADVVVLDEATSGLDPGTEKLVEAAVIAATADRAVLVVAHRMSTARGADRIVVVDTGGVTEIGTHDELLVRGGRYAALVTDFENPG
ncbi:ABC transporter transmembrane domain-containing protein [Frankia sp. ArI3]|nr:ABC transporter transmembrane domain-containing protein [Frankia sp. ArI3]